MLYTLMHLYNLTYYMFFNMLLCTCYKYHHNYTRICMQVRLEWPTDLAINPMDNSMYVLDNNVVLQITENRQVL